MIDKSLALVRSRLNAHLASMFSVSEELVSLSPLTDGEGKPAVEARNRLAMFLTNIAHDSVPRSRRPDISEGVVTALPLHLDIYFMLASGHDPEIYSEGLKLISAALIYFQANPVLTPQNTPEMPEGISQLSIEIANLSFDEIGQLWGNLGGRYAPSVMFKMRSVAIDPGAVSAVAPLIREAGGQARPADADEEAV